MFKKPLLMICMMMILGCTYGQDYLDDPQSFIRDPHFADYKDHLNDLESSYLNKEISYAQYIEQKQRLDYKYEREVKERNSKIISQD